MKRIVFLAWVMVIGCGPLAKVEVNVIGERTALENQVLGTYNSLDREMLLAASVRGVDANGEAHSAPKHSREHQDAVAAMQLLDFHADDIRSMKRLGWVGENSLGLLTPFEMKPKNIPEDLKDFAERYSQDEFALVIRQVNDARQVIMRRVIEMNETLGPDDMTRVSAIFARLNAEKALKGELLQAADGSWRVKGE